MGMVAKKPLKDLLDAEEKQSLEAIYRAFRVPTDQLRRCPDVLHAIGAAFDRANSRRIEPGLLLRYMFNRRKAGDWPKLGRRAEKLTPLFDLLPASQLEALEATYKALGHSIDEYQFQPLLARDLAEHFAQMAGVTEQGEVLVAVMTARRKRGLWPAIFEGQEATESPKPFGDILEVHRKHKYGS